MTRLGTILMVEDSERDAELTLEALAEKLSGGSLQPLLSNLVRTKRVSAADLRELLDLVESQGKKPKTKDRG